MDNVLLASDGVPSAGFLIRQTLEGEALGIAVLERILRELQINRASVKLVNAVQRQIGDERRHVSEYRRLIRRIPSRRGTAADNAWSKIISSLCSPNIDLVAMVVAIYGCIEPFNSIAVEGMLLPQLAGTDIRVVQTILRDESRHIAMLDLFDDLLRTNTIKFDGSISRQYIKSFLSFFGGAILDENGCKVNFSSDAKRSFIIELRSTSKRLMQWEGYRSVSS